MVLSTGCLKGGTDALNGLELELIFLLEVMYFVLLVPCFSILDEEMFYDILKYRFVEVSNSHSCSAYSH